MFFITDDHNRVTLNITDNDPLSDYINASFVKVSNKWLFFPISLCLSVYFTSEEVLYQLSHSVKGLTDEKIWNHMAGWLKQKDKSIVAHILALNWDIYLKVGDGYIL